MTRRQNRETDRTIRRLLQAGDPAGDGSAPDATERGRWRRAALAEASQQPAGQRWRPALLPLAAAALLVATFAFLLMGRESVEGPASPLVALEPALDPQPRSPRQPVLPPARPGEELQEAPLTLARDDPGAALPAPAPVPSPPPLPQLTTAGDPDRPPGLAATRTVHFTAPGGTRIIWTLNPELRLSQQGASS